MVDTTDASLSSLPTSVQVTHDDDDATAASTPLTSLGNDGTSRLGDEDVFRLGFGCHRSACETTATTECSKKRKVGETNLDSRLTGVCPTWPGIEELSKRSLDHFPRPALLFPMPALDFDFRVAVALALDPELSRAANVGADASPTSSSVRPDATARVTAHKDKEIRTMTAGQWSGSFGHGCVLAGGYHVGQARGSRPIRIVESAFVLQTAEAAPAIFEMRTRGSLSGPCSILNMLLAPRRSASSSRDIDIDIDPRQYSFRMFCTVKAVDERYAELVNSGLWVAGGVWKADELIIDAFRVT